MYIYMYSLYINISIFVCPVVDTTLLYVCTLWLGILFTYCSSSGLDTTESISIMCNAIYFSMLSLFSAWFITEGQIDSFLLDLGRDYSKLGTGRQLSREEVRKGWKEARCNGIWIMECGSKFINRNDWGEGLAMVEIGMPMNTNEYQL
jgi:hypothetical protein